MTILLPQNDFLSELLNIGVGRAGAVLSELVGAKVGLSVPEIDICPVTELHQRIKLGADDDNIAVSLGFSGLFSGTALLLLSSFSGILLTRRLLGGQPTLDEVKAELAPATTEVGNIILNSFVGSWSQVFYDRFEFAVPAFARGRTCTLISDAAGTASDSDEQYAIWANAHFDIHEFFIMGTVLALFDKHSIERIVGAVSAPTSS